MNKKFCNHNENKKEREKSQLTKLKLFLQWLKQNVTNLIYYF